MATIGSFRKAGTNLEGSIITLSVQHSDVRFMANDGDRGDKAPAYRIFAGPAEIGAAWVKTGQNERTYLSCKLDDPSFVAPIYSNLFEEEDGSFAIVWIRSSR